MVSPLELELRVCASEVGNHMSNASAFSVVFFGQRLCIFILWRVHPDDFHLDFLLFRCDFHPLSFFGGAFLFQIFVKRAIALFAAMLLNQRIGKISAMPFTPAVGRRLFLTQLSTVDITVAATGLVISIRRICSQLSHLFLTNSVRLMPLHVLHRYSPPCCRRRIPEAADAHRHLVLPCLCTQDNPSRPSTDCRGRM